MAGVRDRQLGLGVRARAQPRSLHPRGRLPQVDQRNSASTSVQSAFLLKRFLNLSKALLTCRYMKCFHMECFLQCPLCSVLLRVSGQNKKNHLFAYRSTCLCFQGLHTLVVVLIEDCFELLDNITGVFTSPNYPRNYGSFTDCIWHIVGEVPLGSGCLRVFIVTIESTLSGCSVFVFCRAEWK